MKFKYFLLILVVALKDTTALSCPFGTVSNGTDCEECGVADVKPNLKIVGGTNAEAHSWPWHVLIGQNIRFDYKYPDPDGYVDKIDDGFYCGGTLINAYTVVSAGHCASNYYISTYKGKETIVDIKPSIYYPTFESMFTIYLGAQDISNIDKSIETPMVKMNVSKVIVHPDFTETTLLNDISILILSKPVEFNKYIKPACLPKEVGNTYPKRGENVVAVGWGYTEQNDQMSSILKNVELKVHKSAKCDSVYQGVLPKNHDSQVCIGKGRKDTCTGDSGGGLYSIDNDNGQIHQVLAGVTSYGDGCAKAGKLGLYTRTSYFKDWIETNMATSAQEASPLSSTPTTKKTTTTKSKTTKKKNTSKKPRKPSTKKKTTKRQSG